jgi:hypothetical protein
MNNLDPRSTRHASVEPSMTTSNIEFTVPTFNLVHKSFRGELPSSVLEPISRGALGFKSSTFIRVLVDGEI